MKKILIVCQRYPIPENHGNPMRTMHFVRSFKDIFADSFEMDIVFTNGHTVIQGAESFQKEYYLPPQKFYNSTKKIFYRLSHNIPSPLLIFSRAGLERFKSIVESTDFHYLLFRYLTSTQLISSLPYHYRKRSIVDFDDIPSDNIYDMNFNSMTRGIKKILSFVNRWMLKQYERKCLSLGAALFCSKRDLDKFETDGDSCNRFVVPNIYHNDSFDHFNFGNGFYNSNNFLFIGNLNYPPNTNGVKWFILDIFSKFRREQSDARFIVIGSAPTPEVVRLCTETPGVELHENISDAKPFYKDCRAVVVPILSGGGTRIKILEAAMTNRPVLSTPLGASGLGLENGSEILLFSNPDEFITCYRTLENPYQYQSIAEKARFNIKSNYTKSTFQHALQKVIDYIERYSSPTHLQV